MITKNEECGRRFPVKRGGAAGSKLLLTGYRGLLLACIVTCCLRHAQAFTVTRTWSLTGEREETFDINDTVTFTISFPGLVPPIYLFGYERFSVTIGDSMSAVSPDAKPALYFSFDAGFLYFDHFLTVTIPFSSPPIAAFARQTGDFRLYRDPFPQPGLHQWYANDSIFVDTVQAIIRFVYHH